MEPVSKRTLISMRNEYDKTIRQISSANLKKRFTERPDIEDASSAWVSRKDLEKLLNDNNANGLRVYYGCHHESTNSDPAKDYKGLHNIILVATKDDLDPENPTCENSKDQLKDEERKPQEATSIQNYAGAGADLFPLCPPLCPK